MKNASYFPNYDTLIQTIQAIKEIIDTRGQLSNFNTNITEIENKIPRTSDLVSKPVSTQRLQKLEIKNLILIVWLKRVIKKQKLQELKVKCQMLVT